MDKQSKVVILKKIKQVSNFLVYFSFFADALIFIADIFLQNLPKENTFNLFSIITGTFTVNGEAVNLLGQQLLIIIVPVTIMGMVAHFIINHYELLPQKLGIAQHFNKNK